MRRAVLLMAMAIALTSCGLPSDGAPRQIADDKVPFELLGPTTTTPTTDVSGNTNVRLYFVSGTQLKAVQRTVPDHQPGTVLNALVKGVADTDPVGLTTALPADTQIVALDTDGSTLVVTLNSAILNVGGAEQKNAFGQFVYTVTDLNFSGVRFRVVDASGGQPQDISVPADNGAKAGPVDRSDFLQLEPRG